MKKKHWEFPSRRRTEQFVLNTKSSDFRRSGTAQLVLDSSAKALLLPPPRRTTDGDVCIETCALPRSRPKSSPSRERGAGVVANRPFACRALALVGSANLLRLIPLLLACSRFRTKGRRESKYGGKF
ncbi:unnamed protein product [Sphagnum balticum]